jgi:hypothetical protein
MTWLLIIVIHFADHDARSAILMADRAACEHVAKNLREHPRVEAQCVLPDQRRHGVR